MKVVHATNFSFYLKAHFFHWNVEGPFFVSLHELFGNIYEDAQGAIDRIAEEIRAIKGYAPGSFSRLSADSKIADQVEVPPAMDMVKMLSKDNDTIIVELLKAQKMAEVEGEMGLANFLQDRIDIHKKHGWMLRATSK
jgi:starvation-inducible DNA-binding protein